MFRVGLHAPGGVPGPGQGIDGAGIPQVGGFLQPVLRDGVVPLFLEDPAEEQHAVGVAQQGCPEEPLGGLVAVRGVVDQETQVDHGVGSPLRRRHPPPTRSLRVVASPVGLETEVNQCFDVL